MTREQASTVAVHAPDCKVDVCTCYVRIIMAALKRAEGKVSR